MTFQGGVKRGAKKTVQVLARGSYVVKGILFCGLALFAARLALGLSRQEPNRKEVLAALFTQPFGRWLLLVMVITLTAHTLWRVVETVRDPYQKGTSPGGLLHRLTYVLSGLSYAGLAITALKLVTGKGQGPDDAKQLWVAQLLYQNGGKGLVVLAGSLIVAWGAVQLKKAFTPGLYQNLRTGHLPPAVRTGIRLLGGVGFTAQAAVLAGIGYSLLRAAWTENARQVKSVDELLELLQHLPHGVVGLYLLAASLFCFGLFMFVMARYFPLKLD
jgi:hypothetical protein